MTHPTIEIPQCARHEFHAKASDYALIIGVYNENAKFTRQLAALQPYRAQVDIIIADGNSTDGATAPEVLASQVRCLLVNTDRQKGLSVQYRGALHYAVAQGYEGILMMDGNGKDGVGAVDNFIRKLREGYDFVQGSRFLPGGRHENTPFDRVWGIKLVFNPIMRVASGFAYTDAMNGFKGCSRTFLTDPRMQPFRQVFERYNLQYYCNYIAPKIGMRITEIPVSRCYSNDNLPYSKIIGLHARLKIIRELLYTVTGRYNPK